MTFDASLDLFALVWVLLCTVAAALVYDSLPQDLHRPGTGRGSGEPALRRGGSARSALPALRREPISPACCVSRAEPGALHSSRDVT